MRANRCSPGPSSRSTVHRQGVWHVGAWLVAMLTLVSCSSGSESSTPTPTTPETTSPPTQTSEPESTPESTLDFYAGETVTILVPVAPGGAVDTTARFWAQWLPNYLEGNPSFVVENMPGGGQIIAGNYFEQQTERDGLTLMLQGTTGHFAWRFGLAGVEYDVGDWEVLISNPGGDVWYTDPETSGIHGLQDLIAGNHEDLYFAGQGSPGGSDLFKVWAFHLLGIDPQTTWGYEGRAQGRVAFEQGEANIDVQATASYPNAVAPSVEAGENLLLFSMGQVQGRDLVRDSFWPDLPHVGEVYEMMFGQEPSGLGWVALLLGGAMSRTLSRTLYIHGESPPEAIVTLQHAIESMVSDPVYLEAQQEALGPYQSNVGQAVRDIVQLSLIDVDQEVIDFMVDFVAERYDHDMIDG